MSIVTYTLLIKDRQNPELNENVEALIEVEKRTIVSDVSVLLKMIDALTEEDKKKKKKFDVV